MQEDTYVFLSFPDMNLCPGDQVRFPARDCNGQTCPGTCETIETASDSTGVTQSETACCIGG